VIDVSGPSWSAARTHRESIRMAQLCGCGELGGPRPTSDADRFDAARPKGLRYLHHTGKRRFDNWDAGSWRVKDTAWRRGGGFPLAGMSILFRGTKSLLCCTRPTGHVIKKHEAVGFFGTNLPPTSPGRCDSVTGRGTTTSGWSGHRGRTLSSRPRDRGRRVLEKRSQPYVSLCDMPANTPTSSLWPQSFSYSISCPRLFDLPSGTRSTAPSIGMQAEIEHPEVAG